ncbi:MAG: endonuclease III [Kiritimatiellae bacterium]|nr:endonuclease III [Kiritimatiellia bacterium]MCO5068623.1 endonuclease III [Kiritimatiellia bacterium]
MTRQERADFIGKELDKLFPRVGVTLAHTDAYTLLVAVILSAQCTDKRVDEVTPHLFAVADTPEKMRKLTARQIETIIRPCGLAPTKSKNIRATSQILVEKYGGAVPRTFEELEALPGVGHKTASIVMSRAFGVPAFPVDTHIHRLSKRWKLTRGRNVVETERDLKKLYPKEEWYRRHLQIIFYGRAHCSARGCDGTRCPICAALNGPRKERHPQRKRT